MTKKLEDYKLIPESEVSDKNKSIYAKWREKWKKANEELFEADSVAAEDELENYIELRRKNALKKADDRKEYDEHEKNDTLDELSEDNFFHPKNTVGGVAGHDSVDVVDVDGQNAGMKINMRPQLAVNIMKVEFPEEILVELNDHVDTEIIPNNTDHSKGLVGQINRTEKSKQLTFPHEGDEVGEMFAGVLESLAKQYVRGTLGKDCSPSVDSMWTVHSYEGDYNPLHDHGTKSAMGLSCIFYMKVPEQIQKLGNPDEEFAGLNHSSGAVDGFTYLTWGTNGHRDVNMLRPVTEEYIQPVEGMLIMFPSWLRHSVNPFFGEGERRTFSANISINPANEDSV